MSQGLYRSIFDKQGIYNPFYRRGGGQQPMKSTDQRLGESDDDDETPAPPAPPTTAPPSPSNSPKESIFAREYEGFPMWVAGLFLLGFAWAYRKRKKEQK